MDGEFVCEATTGLTKAGVGGGNLIIMGESARQTLAAAEAAVKAIDGVPDAIMPFPGGIARSGSKVGAKYKSMRASTNDAYCPTLRGAGRERARSGHSVGAGDRHRRAHARCASRRPCAPGSTAIIKLGPERGAVRISAGNYGGKLGPHHFHLKDLLP